MQASTSPSSPRRGHYQQFVCIKVRICCCLGLEMPTFRHVFVRVLKKPALLCTHFSEEAQTNMLLLSKSTDKRIQLIVLAILLRKIAHHCVVLADAKLRFQSASVSFVPLRSCKHGSAAKTKPSDTNSRIARTPNGGA